MDIAELALHLRLLAGDKTAADDCVEHWLPQLVSRLSFHFRDVASRDDHLITSAVLDTLFDYTLAPSNYNAERSSLKSYLFRAARGDLINALHRERTQGRSAIPITSVEQWLPDGNDSIEDQVISKTDARAAWQLVMLEITDPTDRHILALLMSGERATKFYAQTLGIQHLPENEQRAIVKRHKDRLSKRLERMRESLHGW